LLGFFFFFCVSVFFFLFFFVYLPKKKKKKNAGGGGGGGGGVKRPMPRADKLNTFMCRLSWNLGAWTSLNPQGLSRPVMRLLYLYLHCTSYNSDSTVARLWNGRLTNLSSFVSRGRNFALLNCSKNVSVPHPAFYPTNFIPYSSQQNNTRITENTFGI